VRGACNSMMPRYHGILFRYILNDLDMVPVASIATGITCRSIPLMLYFCHKMVFIFYSISGFFLNHVCIPHIYAMSVNRRGPFSSLFSSYYFYYNSV
jgi:hypothetical protein